MTAPLDPASVAYRRAVLAGDQPEVDRLGLVLDCADRIDAMHRNDLPARALEYAQRGIPVFPCEPGGKRPATKHGFKDASTDPDVVAVWWRRVPTANIGTPTGLSFDVYDIDGPEGVRTMWGTRQPFGGCLADRLTITAHVTTPRPAGHHLYIPPDPSRRNGQQVWPGIDIRARGGYVVVPPSVGENGKEYQWLHKA